MPRITPGAAEGKVASPEVRILRAHESAFEDALALWAEERATLGFFPRGAFEEHAQKGWLLGAFADGGLVGYLLYRRVARRATIVHLCSRRDARGTGIARGLVTFLREGLRDDVVGIEAKCRQDYEASHLWPRLGFVPISETQGRAGVLVRWWLDLCAPDLFTKLARDELGDRTIVAIDANVFFDLEVAGRPNSDHAQSLAAAWLEDDIAVCVTGELLTEIQRNGDATARAELKRAYRKYRQLRASPKAVEAARHAVASVLPVPRSHRSESDIRQLAHAVAAEASVFATRDQTLIDAAEAIYEATGLNVVHPAEVATRLQELADDSRFRPVALKGTAIISTPPRVNELRALALAFQRKDAAEPVGELLARMRAQLSASADRVFEVVRDGERPLAVAIATGGPRATIDLLRVVPSRIAGTLLRHVLNRLVASLTRGGATRIVASTECSRAHEALLRECGFVDDGEHLLKICLTGLLGPSDLRARLSAALSGELFEAFEKAIEVAEAGHRSIAAQLEKVLSPARVCGLGIPSFLVPIRPEWAIHLFDDSMPQGELFATPAELILREEKVYYRSAHATGGIASPARILWYVSGPRAGAQTVRAVSMLDEAVVGTPKRLFRRFRRLGVYQWQDVYALAGKRVEGRLMALRFSATELLPNPVALRQVQRIRARNDRRANQIQGPTRVSEETFREIYSLGSNHQEPG